MTSGRSCVCRSCLPAVVLLGCCGGHRASGAAGEDRMAGTSLLSGLFHRYRLLVVWVVINGCIFWRSYCFYKDKPQHVYLRKILGHGLCISRATASVLNVSCCLVLLPVCRGLNSVIHAALSRVSRSALDFWLCRVKVVHLTCAYTIILAAVVHSAAHIVNAVNFSQNYDHEHKEINWAEYEGQEPAFLILTSVAGLTGVAMMLLLAVLSLSSMRWVRASRYGVFWAVHQLFLPFLLLWLAHPLSGVLKELSNYDSHSPGCSYDNITSSTPEVGASVRCAKPVFLNMDSQGWAWVCVPLVLYCVDVVCRVVRRNQSRARVLQVERVAGAVKLRLQMVAQPFEGRAGQYVLLQCPVISAIQWHPFTLISCPSTKDPSFSVLVKSTGDWTESLYGRVLLPLSGLCDTAELCRWPRAEPVTFLIDGPYWSPMQGVLHSGVAVCVAAGVGVTPFMTAMQELLDNGDTSASPRRLHLIWVLRDCTQIAWSGQLICSLHLKFWSANQPDRFSFQIFVTRGFDAKTLDNKQRLLLLPRVFKGRPDWTELFQDFQNIYPRQNVSVFSCAPKALNQEIRTQCLMANSRGSNFHFVHEAFS